MSDSFESSSEYYKVNNLRIGILTFHSQLNYGGVLQCWALQTALEKLGHTVVVIDRWMDSDNSALEAGYNKFGLGSWAKFAFRTLLGLGDINHLLRVKRTKNFITTHLKLSPYHFVKWQDSPAKLDVDLLIVGSDQVWHFDKSSDPRVYLLEGAPQISAITYAASFGMPELPVKCLDLFRDGLSRFKAISCREQEGVNICRKMGFDAMHVVDPTLLAWGCDSLSRSKTTKRRDLVCYFLSENIDNHISALIKFAEKNMCKVKVFLSGAYLLPFPSSLTSIKKVLNGWRNRMGSRIEIMDSAGPEEFFEAFSGAQWVVSDSFHALMFSICNDCNVRMIRPTSSYRLNMFARIEEFASHTKGPLIVDSVSNALESLINGEKVEFDHCWIDACCQESQTWLNRNLG